MPTIPRPSYPMAWGARQVAADLMAQGVDVKTAQAFARTLDKILAKQAIDERLNYRTIEDNIDAAGDGPPGAITVAAADSTLRARTSADYVCDGVSDQTEINAAIVAAQTAEGITYLHEGTYWVSAPVTIVTFTHLKGASERLTVIRNATNPPGDYALMQAQSLASNWIVEDLWLRMIDIVES